MARETKPVAAATKDASFKLPSAKELMQKQIELFADEAGGGFYFTSSDHEALLARGKEIVDTAVPSGNSVSAHNLIRLADSDSSTDYRLRADKTIRASAAVLESNPSAAPRMAAAVPALIAARQKSLAENLNKAEK